MSKQSVKMMSKQRCPIRLGRSFQNGFHNDHFLCTHTYLIVVKICYCKTVNSFFIPGPRRYQGDKKVMSMQQGGIRSTRKFLTNIFTIQKYLIMDNYLKNFIL